MCQKSKKMIEYLKKRDVTMPKGRTNKKLHSNNGVLCKYSHLQHLLKPIFEIVILEEKTTYNKAFNDLMQVVYMSHSHSMKQIYVINVNGLTVEELNHLLSRFQSN